MIGYLLVILTIGYFDRLRNMSLDARMFASRGVALRPSKTPILTAAGIYSARVLVPLGWAAVSLICMTLVVASLTEDASARFVENELALANSACNETYVFLRRDIFVQVPLAANSSALPDEAGGDWASWVNVTSVAFCFNADNTASPVAAPEGIFQASTYLVILASFAPWLSSVLPFVLSVYGTIPAVQFSQTDYHDDIGTHGHTWYMTSIDVMQAAIERTAFAIDIAAKAKAPLSRTSTTTWEEYLWKGVIYDYAEDYGDLAIFFAFHASGRLPQPWFIRVLHCRFRSDPVDSTEDKLQVTS